ncbi:hypothetical protein NUW54_g9986 [Trametes sanguinea]|uniref:Uncharacterized protein n=1 Tax=Trametes sanguinea TaxID=158606 RepID=A0ACC1P4T1_9APHY|nr:hypothetical protein NUW54_g9986 [Trametes sanguinea]
MQRRCARLDGDFKSAETSSYPARLPECGCCTERIGNAWSSPAIPEPWFVLLEVGEIARPIKQDGHWQTTGRITLTKLKVSLTARNDEQHAHDDRFLMRGETPPIGGGRGRDVKTANDARKNTVKLGV